ncbi:DUF5684 domain-containing protein [Microbacterium sp. NPDC089189]|uniref:DUF5684 domain-containing protein n=1 Tax=Microbacterium sp. NPDC089189 TaxID=3154972 RepID=UPI00341A108F
MNTESWWDAYAAWTSAWYVSIPSLVIAVLQIAGTWATFRKAGRPGWAAIVPFYNAYTYLKVGQKPGWWLILWILPIVGLVITIITALAIARNFGRSALFGVVGLWFFPFVGYPILGWGSDTYRPVDDGSIPPSTAPQPA